MSNKPEMDDIDAMRAILSGLAMQGLLSSRPVQGLEVCPIPDGQHGAYAKESIKFADALIHELFKTKP